jgi:hypothetical protein
MFGLLRDKNDVSLEQDRLSRPPETKVGEPKALQICGCDVRRFVAGRPALQPAPAVFRVLKLNHGKDLSA